MQAASENTASSALLIGDFLAAREKSRVPCQEPGY
jgi:hypothetical protein